MSLLKEPLFHFLALGALLFLTYSQFKPSLPVRPITQPIDESRQVRISASDLQLLRQNWEQEWHRPPTQQEFDILRNGFIREELLLREALTLGLHRDDPVVRQRLAQRAEFLSQDLAAHSNIEDSDLNAFFEARKEDYRVPEEITFEHIFINPQRHSSPNDTARQILANLRSGGTKKSPSDRSLLERGQPQRTRDEISDLFGIDFTEQLFKLHTGDWQGPITSKVGVHLVKVSLSSPSHIPPLTEIREEVRKDLLNERRRTAGEKLYHQLLERYQVVIEEQDQAAVTQGKVETRP